MTRRLLDRVDAATVLAGLGSRAVSYDPAGVDPHWRHDELRFAIARERPGPPEPHGAWQRARRAVDAYEFSDPSVIRAVYDAEAPLLGRDMLLEGRWGMLRFYMGVRVTAVVDEERPGATVWGWAYETLEGHLECGRMSYEVVKEHATGEVQLDVRAVSRGAPTLGPVTTLGWRLFGRRTQLAFYAACGRRLAAIVAAGTPGPAPTRRWGSLVLAPSDARRRWWDAFAVRRHQPG